MGNVAWKTCKILESLIGTEEDINRRKTLAIEAYKTLNSIFSSAKISTQITLRTTDFLYSFNNSFNFIVVGITVIYLLYFIDSRCSSLKFFVFVSLLGSQRADFVTNKRTCNADIEIHKRGTHLALK